MFEREFEQGVVPFQFEFLADAGAVVFDGADAEAELVGDLLIRLVFGNQLEHAPFDGGQLGQPWLLGGQPGGAAAAIEQERSELRADIFLTGGHGANAMDDLGQRAVLEDVAFSPPDRAPG
jgi:hypothetical protein